MATNVNQDGGTGDPHDIAVAKGLPSREDFIVQAGSVTAQQIFDINAVLLDGQRSDAGSLAGFGAEDGNLFPGL